MDCRALEFNEEWWPRYRSTLHVDQANKSEVTAASTLAQEPGRSLLGCSATSILFLPFIDLLAANGGSEHRPGFLPDECGDETR